MTSTWTRAGALALAAGMGAHAGTARAVCRVVEPSTEEGVGFDPTTRVLFVLAPDQIVDYRCPTPAPTESDAGTIEDPDAGLGAPPDDAGVPMGMGGGGEDAGEALDAGIDDAGEVVDAGESEDAAEADGAGPDDAGASDDAGEPGGFTCPDGSEPEPIYGTLVHMVLQPSIYAAPGNAGLVMPVPARADVHVAPASIFTTVEALQRGGRVVETVEWVEDPSLGWACGDPHYSSVEPSLLEGIASAPLMLAGCGSDGAGGYYRPGLERSDATVIDSDAGRVVVEEIPTTDDYTVSVLNASSPDVLGEWLDTRRFAHDAVDDAAFGAYVGEQSWFVAIHVHPTEGEGSLRALAPIVVTFRADSIPIPNRLQYEPGGARIFTDAFVMAPARMALEDGTGETRYADVASFGFSPDLRDFGLGSGWLTRLYLERNPNEEIADTTLVPSADGAVVREDMHVRTRIRMPMACCSDGSVPYSPPPGRTFTETREYEIGRAPPDYGFYRAPALAATYCGTGYGSGGSYDGSYDGCGGGGYGGCACTSRDGCVCAVEHPRPRSPLAFLSWLPAVIVGASLWWRRRR